MSAISFSPPLAIPKSNPILRHALTILRIVVTCGGLLVLTAGAIWYSVGQDAETSSQADPL